MLLDVAGSEWEIERVELRDCVTVGVLQGEADCVTLLDNEYELDCEGVCESVCEDVSVDESVGD